MPEFLDRLFGRGQAPSAPMNLALDDIWSRAQPGDIIINYMPRNAAESARAVADESRYRVLNTVAGVVPRFSGEGHHAAVVVDPSKRQTIGTSIQEGARQYTPKPDDDFILLRPRDMDEAARARFLERIKSKAAQNVPYGERRVMATSLGNLVPGGGVLSEFASVCSGDICSTLPAKELAKEGVKVRPGVPAGAVMPADFVRSGAFEEVGRTGGKGARAAIGRNAALPGRVLGNLAFAAGAYGLGDLLHTGPKELARQQALQAGGTLVSNRMKQSSSSQQSESPKSTPNTEVLVYDRIDRLFSDRLTQTLLQRSGVLS